MDSRSSFRVIIVGGGPVGLYMAHAMNKANIEYILLEQQPTVLSPSGQLLFTWPQTVRLFDQIDIADEVRNLAFVMEQKKRVHGENGSITSINHFWKFMHSNHGYPFMPLLRSDLMKALYLNLKNRERCVKTSAEVVDLDIHDNGVRAHLSNGDIIEGSIVIGADGVHSKIRKAMQKHATLFSDGTAFSNPMVSTFYGIFGRSSNVGLGIETGVFFESRGAGAVIQCLATENTVQFVTLKPLPQPTAGRNRYSSGDTEKYAASIGEIFVCPGVKFKELWAKADKTTTRLLNQEEGLVKRWNYGRVVLVGDAAHKNTSVNGLGLTCGLHSAAVLANELQHLVATHSEPSTALIDRAFANYQAARETEVKSILGAGQAMVREVTRKSWWNLFWDMYVLPWIDIEQLLSGIIPSYALIRYGQTLKYVPFVGENGRVPWVHKPAVFK